MIVLLTCFLKSGSDDGDEDEDEALLVNTTVLSGKPVGVLNTLDDEP